MFQRVGLALSMSGSVLSASFWRVDVRCACLVAFSLCQATLCFFLVSQFSSVFALFTFVPTTVFSNSSRASLDSLWSWRLAMVGSVCVD